MEARSSLLHRLADWPPVVAVGVSLGLIRFTSLAHHSWAYFGLGSLCFVSAILSFGSPSLGELPRAVRPAAPLIYLYLFSLAFWSGLRLLRLGR